MWEIFKANQRTSASYEATMSNLDAVADSLCTEGEQAFGAPPYLTCSVPSDDCTPPLPIYTTQTIDDTEAERDDSEAEPTDDDDDEGGENNTAGGGEAAAVLGSANSISSKLTVILMIGAVIMRLL